MDNLVIVIRDMICIADASITNFCQILVYQNGELLDAESGLWNHLDTIELMRAVR